MLINYISIFFKNDNSFVKNCVFVSSKADTPLYLGPSFLQNTVKWRGYSGIFQYTYLLKGYGVEVSTGLKKTILVPTRAFSGWYRNCKYSLTIGSLVAYKVAYKGPFFITKTFTRYGYTKNDPLRISFYNSAEIPLFRLFYKAVKLFKKSYFAGTFTDTCFQHYFTRSLAFARFFSPKYTPLTTTYHFMVELQLLRTRGSQYSQQFSDDYYLPSMTWIKFPLDSYLTLRETSSNLLFSGKHLFRTYNSIMAYWLDIYLRPTTYIFADTLFFKFFSRLLVLRKSNLSTTYVSHALSGFNVFHSFFFTFNDCYNVVNTTNPVMSVFFYINLLTLILLKSASIRKSLFFLFFIILRLFIDLLYASFYQKLVCNYSFFSTHRKFNFVFLFKTLTILFFKYFKMFFVKNSVRYNSTFNLDSMALTNLNSTSFSFIKTSLFFTIFKLISFVFLFSNFFTQNSYTLADDWKLNMHLSYLFKLNHKFLKYLEYLPKFLPLYINTESKYFLLNKINFKKQDILLSTRTNSKFFSSANFNLVDPTINEMDTEISSDIIQRFFLKGKGWLKRRFYKKTYLIDEGNFNKKAQEKYPFFVWDPFRKFKFFKKYKPRIRPFTRAHLHINKMRLFRYKKAKFRRRATRNLGYYKKLKFYRKRLRRKTLFLFRGISGLEYTSTSWKKEDLTAQKEHFIELLKKKKNIYSFKELDDTPSFKNYLEFLIYYFNKGLSCTCTYQIFSKKLAALTTSISNTTKITKLASEPFVGNTFLNTLRDRDLNSNFLFKNNIFSNRLLRFFNGISLDFSTQRFNLNSSKATNFLTSSLNFTGKLLSLSLFRSFLRRKHPEAYYVDRFADVKFQKWFHSWIREVLQMPKGVFLPKTTPTRSLLKKKNIFRSKKNDALQPIIKSKAVRTRLAQLQDTWTSEDLCPNNRQYRKKRTFFFLRNKAPVFRSVVYNRKWKVYRKLIKFYFNGKLRLPKWLWYALKLKKKKPVKVLTKKKEELLKKRPKISISFRKKVLKNSIFQNFFRSITFFHKGNVYNPWLRNLSLKLRRSMFYKKTFVFLVKRLLYHDFLKRIILKKSPLLTKPMSYILNVPSYKEEDFFVSLQNVKFNKKKRIKSLPKTALYLLNLKNFFSNYVKNLFYTIANPILKKKTNKKMFFFRIKKFKFNYNYFYNTFNTNFFFSKNLNRRIQFFLYGLSPFLKYRLASTLRIINHIIIPNFFFIKKKYESSLLPFFSKFIYLKNIYAANKEWPFNFFRSKRFNNISNTGVFVRKKLNKNIILTHNVVDLSPNTILIGNLCRRNYNRVFTYYRISRNNYIAQFLNEIKLYWNLKKKKSKNICPNPWKFGLQKKKIRIDSFLSKNIKFRKLKTFAPTSIRVTRNVPNTQKHRKNIKALAKYLIHGDRKKLYDFVKSNRLTWTRFNRRWDIWRRFRTKSFYRLLYKLGKFRGRRRIKYFRTLLNPLTFINKRYFGLFTFLKKNKIASLLKIKWKNKFLKTKKTTNYLSINTKLSTPFLTFLSPSYGLINILKSWHFVVANLLSNLSLLRKFRLILLYFFKKLINLVKLKKINLNFTKLSNSAYLRPFSNKMCYSKLSNNLWNYRFVNKCLLNNSNKHTRPFSFYLSNKSNTVDYTCSTRTQRISNSLNFSLNSSLVRFFNLNSVLFSPIFFTKKKLTKKKKIKYFFYVKNKFNKLISRNKTLADTKNIYKLLSGILQKKLNYFYLKNKINKINLNQRNFLSNNLFYTYLFKRFQLLKKFPAASIRFVEKRTALKKKQFKDFLFFFKRYKNRVQRIALGWATYSHLVKNKSYPWYWSRRKGANLFRPLRHASEYLTRLIHIKNLNKKIRNKLIFFSKSVKYRTRLVFNNITAADAFVARNSTIARDFYVDLKSKKAVNFINNFKDASSLSKMHTFLYFWFFSSDIFSLKSEDISMEYNVNTDKAYYPAGKPVFMKNYASLDLTYNLNWVEFLNKFKISSTPLEIESLKKLRDLALEDKQFPFTELEELLDIRGKIDVQNLLKSGLIFRKNLGTPPGAFTNRLRIWDLLPKMFQLNKSFALIISNLSVLNFSKNLRVTRTDNTLYLRKKNLIFSTFFCNSLENSAVFSSYKWTLNSLSTVTFRFFFLFVKVYTFFTVFVENTNPSVKHNLLFIVNFSLFNSSIIRKNYLTSCLNSVDKLSQRDDILKFNKILNLYLDDHLINLTTLRFKKDTSPIIFYYNLIMHKTIFLFKKFSFYSFELFKLNFKSKLDIFKSLSCSSRLPFKKIFNFIGKPSFYLKKRKLIHFLRLKNSSWSIARKKRIKTPSYLYYTSTNYYYANTNTIWIKALYSKPYYNTTKHWGLRDLVKNWSSRKFFLNLNYYNTSFFSKKFKHFVLPKALLWGKPQKPIFKTSEEALNYLQVNYTKQNCINFSSKIRFALAKASNYFKHRRTFTWKHLFSMYVSLRKFYSFFKKSALMSKKIFDKLPYDTLKIKLLNVLSLIKKAYKTNNIIIRQNAAFFAFKLFKDIAVFIPLIKSYIFKRVAFIIVILKDIILSYSSIIKDLARRKRVSASLNKEKILKSDIVNAYKNKNKRTEKLLNSKKVLSDTPEVPVCIKQIYKDFAYLRRGVKLIPAENIINDDFSEKEEILLNCERIHGPIITLSRILKKLYYLLKKGKSFFIANGAYLRRLSYNLRTISTVIYKNVDRFIPKHKLIYKEELYPMLKNIPLFLKLLRLFSLRSNKVYTFAAVLHRYNSFYEDEYASNLLYSTQFLSNNNLYNLTTAKLLRSFSVIFSDSKFKFEKFKILSNIQEKLNTICNYTNNSKILNIYIKLKNIVNLVSDSTSWNFYFYFYKLFIKIYILFYFLQRLIDAKLLFINKFKRFITRVLKLALKQLFLKLSNFFDLDKIFASKAKSIIRITTTFFSSLVNYFVFDSTSLFTTKCNKIFELTGITDKKLTISSAISTDKITDLNNSITLGSNFFFKSKFLFSLKVFFGEFYFYKSKALSPLFATVWQFFSNTTDTALEKVTLDFSYNLLFRVFYVIYHPINRFVKKFSVISEKKIFDYEKKNRKKPDSHYIEATKRMHYRHVLRKCLYNYLSSFQANRVKNKYKEALRLPKTSLRFIGARKRVSALLVWYLNFLNFFTIYRTSSGFFKILRRVFKLFRFLKIFFLRYYLIIFLLQQVFMKKTHWNRYGYTWVKKIFLIMHFFLNTLNKVFKVFLSFVRVMFKNFFAPSLNNTFFTTLKDSLVNFYKEKLVFYSRSCSNILSNNRLATYYVDFNGLQTTKASDSFSFLNCDLFTCSLNLKNYFVKRLSFASILPTNAQLTYDFYAVLTGTADDFYFKFLLAVKKQLRLSIKKSFFFKKKMLPYKRKHLLLSPSKIATADKKLEDFYHLIIPEIIFNLLKNENKYVFRGFSNFLIFCLSSRKKLYTTFYQFFYFFDYDSAVETFFDKILPFKSNFASSMSSIYFSYAAYFKNTFLFINFFDSKNIPVIENLNFSNYWNRLTIAKKNNKDHINNWSALNKRKRDTKHIFFDSFYFFKHYNVIFITFLKNFYKITKIFDRILKHQKSLFIPTFNKKKVEKFFICSYTYNSAPFVYLKKLGNFATTANFSLLLNYYKLLCLAACTSAELDFSKKEFWPARRYLSLLSTKKINKERFYNVSYSVLTSFYEYTLYHRYNYWKKFFYRNIVKIFEFNIVISSAKFKKLIFSAWSNIFISYSLYYTCVIKRGTFTFKGLCKFNSLYKFARASFISIFFILKLNLVYSYFLKRTYFHTYLYLVFLIFWVTRIFLFWHNYLYLSSVNTTYNLKINYPQLYSKEFNFTFFFKADTKLFFKSKNLSYFFYFFRIFLNKSALNLVNSSTVLFNKNTKKISFLFLNYYISTRFYFNLNTNIYLCRFNPFFFKNIYFSSYFFNTEKYVFTTSFITIITENNFLNVVKTVEYNSIIPIFRGIHNFYKYIQITNFIKVMRHNYNLLNLFFNNFRAYSVEKRYLLNFLNYTDDFIFRFKKFSKGPGHLKPIQLYLLSTDKNFKVIKQFTNSYKTRLKALYKNFFLKKKINFLFFFLSAFYKYKSFLNTYSVTENLSKTYRNFLQYSWINLHFLKKKFIANFDIFFEKFSVNSRVLTSNFNTFTQYYLLNVARSYSRFRQRTARWKWSNSLFLNNTYKERKEHFISYLFKRNKKKVKLRASKKTKKIFRKKKVYNAVEMEFIRRRRLVPFLFPKKRKKSLLILKMKRNRLKARKLIKQLPTSSIYRGRRMYSILLPIFKKAVKINLEFLKYIYGGRKTFRKLKRSRYSPVATTYKRILSHSTTLLKRQKFKCFIRNKRAHLSALSKNFINIKYHNLLKMLKRRFFTFFLNFKKFFFLNFLRVTDKYLSLLLQSKLFSFFNKYRFFYDFFNFFLRTFFKMRWLFFFRYFCFLRLVSTRCSFFLLTFNLKNFFFAKKL